MRWILFEKAWTLLCFPKKWLLHQSTFQSCCWSLVLSFSSNYDLRTSSMKGSKGSPSFSQHTTRESSSIVKVLVLSSANNCKLTLYFEWWSLLRRHSSTYNKNVWLHNYNVHTWAHWVAYMIIIISIHNWYTLLAHIPYGANVWQGKIWQI